MADRPLGVEPAYQRDFNVVSFSCGPMTRRERLSEWWHHVWNYSFGRGSILELELDDDTIQFLYEVGWVRRRGDELFFTRKGSEELVQFCRQEIARIKNDDD